MVHADYGEGVTVEDEIIEPGAEAPAGPDALDRIMMEATGMEREADAAQEAAMADPDAKPPVDPALAWAQIPFMLGNMLAMAMPELKGVYTEAACHQWGAGMAALSAKYGWDAGDTIAKWGPECMLVMASVPLIVPTVQAVKTRQAAIKAAERAKLQERRENAVAVAPGAQAGQYDGNPMMQPPGNFSEPH